MEFPHQIANSSNPLQIPINYFLWTTLIISPQTISFSIVAYFHGSILTCVHFFSPQFMLHIPSSRPRLFNHLDLIAQINNFKFGTESFQQTSCTKILKPIYEFGVSDLHFLGVRCLNWCNCLRYKPNLFFYGYSVYLESISVRCHFWQLLLWNTIRIRSPSIF
jgi:hypothetical protein